MYVPHTATSAANLPFAAVVVAAFCFVVTLFATRYSSPSDYQLIYNIDELVLAYWSAHHWTSGSLSTRFSKKGISYNVNEWIFAARHAAITIQFNTRFPLFCSCDCFDWNIDARTERFPKKLFHVIFYFWLFPLWKPRCSRRIDADTKLLFAIICVLIMNYDAIIVILNNKHNFVSFDENLFTLAAAGHFDFPHNTQSYWECSERSESHWQSLYLRQCCQAQYVLAMLPSKSTLTAHPANQINAERMKQLDCKNEIYQIVNKFSDLKFTMHLNIPIFRTWVVLHRKKIKRTLSV